MASMSNSEKEDLRLNFKEFLSGDIWGLAIDDFLEMNCICESTFCFKIHAGDLCTIFRKIFFRTVAFCNRELHFFPFKEQSNL